MSLLIKSIDAWGNPTVKWTPSQAGSDSGDVITTSSSVIPTEERLSASGGGIQQTDELAKQLSTINPYTYASYRYDSDTGIYYLRARYYDPVTGRFLSKDPILKESISKEISDIAKANPLVKDIADEITDDIKQNHPYAYAKNNPVNYIDPSGQWYYVVVYVYLAYPYVLRWAYFWRVPTFALARSSLRRALGWYYYRMYRVYHRIGWM